VVLFAVAACTLPAAAPVAAHEGGGSSASANSATFNDPLDTTGGGYELTTVTISNDDAGTVHFRISIPSHQGPQQAKGLVLIIDTDRNQGTGGAGGEFRVYYGPEGAPSFNRWNPATSAWNIVPDVLLATTFAGGVWSGSFRSSGIGVNVFDFHVGAFNVNSDASRPTVDRAPNTGVWTYEVRIGPPPAEKQLAIRSFAQSPQPPIAGESFRVSFGVQRIGYPGRWTGVLYCEAKVAGRKLRQFASPQPGRGACQWDVPANAAGKLLVGFVEVSEGDARAARRAFRARVRTPLARLVLPPNAVTTVPAQPAAGTQFFYALNVSVRRGSGRPTPIERGNVTCKATIGGDRLKVFTKRVRAGDGDALCGWEIPHGTSGRTMIGSIVVASEGRTLTHRFTRRVR
jgi:hypothetical protein